MSALLAVARPRPARSRHCAARSSSKDASRDGGAGRAAARGDEVDPGPEARLVVERDERLVRPRPERDGELAPRVLGPGDVPELEGRLHVAGLVDDGERRVVAAQEPRAPAAAALPEGPRAPDLDDRLLAAPVGVALVVEVPDGEHSAITLRRVG